MQSKKSRSRQDTRQTHSVNKKPKHHKNYSSSSKGSRSLEVKGWDANQSKHGQTNKQQYYVFWKPYDVLSQFTPAQGSNAQTLASFIPTKDIYPVGRLDRDSEGILLLSDDGLFQHKLCDPRFEHWRTYLVQVERIPNDEALEKLRTGVVIKGQLTRPAQVMLLNESPDLPARLPPIRARKTVDTAWLRLSLTEGMNRQVRRMTAAVGHPTLRLVRESIQLSPDVQISIKSLKSGEIRAFNQSELAATHSVKKRKARRTIQRKKTTNKHPQRNGNE